MEELRSCSANACAWLNENEDELVRELLDDESPFFFLAKEAITSSESKLMSASPANHDEQAINQLISKVYSGPTIQDIENALSMTTTSQKDPSQQISQARISLLQRGLSKIENNKYTLKLKSCGNGMADDGYKWRKYGQKSIKNSPFPRSYYRCTNPRCSAKKQVERSIEDQDTLVITYEGLHLHFAYPYFFFNQSQQQPDVVDPPSKKMKRAILQDKSQANETQQRQQDQAQECSTNVTTSSPAAGSLPCTIDNYVQEPELCPQGLLEDVVVPYMIGNPSNYNVSSNSSSSSSSSYSYPTSPSSFSWSPNQYNLSCVDIGTNTSIR